MGRRFLGIDGGGSSTRAIVLDTDTGLMEERRSGPSNVLVIGEERAAEALRSLIRPDEHFQAAVVGIAGADRPWVRAFWERAVTPMADMVWVMGDYRTAWAALTDGAPGLVAIFGTGSVFYAENGDHQARLGGYGWKVGDVGSGIMLGQLAVRAALAHLDGWGPSTALTDRVLTWAQVRDKTALLNHVYAPEVDWRSVSDLAAPTFAAAAEGDGVAEALLAEEGDRILRYLEATARAAELSPRDPVGFSGGLARFWHGRLNGWWQGQRGAALDVVTREAGEGAVRLAQRWYHTQSMGGGQH